MIPVDELLARLDAHDLNLCDTWVDEQDRVEWQDEADKLLSEAAALIRSLAAERDEWMRKFELADINHRDYRQLSMDEVRARDAVEAENVVLRRALEPFAEVLDEYDPDDEHDETPATLVVGSVTDYSLTLGDLRRARAAAGRAKG